MIPPVEAAAQYVRMSTDRQDLSPALQKEAIASYARDHGFTIVALYEDDARSGLHVENRRALRRLLKDITGEPAFGTVLVYDVSRWGPWLPSTAGIFPSRPGPGKLASYLRAFR